MAAGAIVIYALCDPDTGECRYVGKANDMRARSRGHRWEARGKRFQTRKARWLRSLGGREPAVRVLEVVAPDQWAEAERRWIAEMRLRGADLTNFADGGQTSPVEGRGHTQASKEKMRAAALANGARPPSRKGATVSAETREKLRASSLRNRNEPPPRGGWNKGLKMSDEFVEKNRRAHVGKPWSPARRAAQNLREGV